MILFYYIYYFLVMNSFGYIYIRTHYAYDIFDACKLGITTNIPERDSLYSTSEIIKGFFHSVYQIDINNNNLIEIEKKLHKQFENYHIKFNSGTEFYKKNIINLIEPIFDKINIKYVKLNNDDIDKLKRKTRIKNNKVNKDIDNKINTITNILNKLDNKDLLNIINNNIKSDIKSDIKIDNNQNIKQDINSDIKIDIKQDIKPVIKPDIKQDIKQVIKQVIKQDIKPDIKLDIKSDIKKDIDDDIKEENKNNNYTKLRSHQIECIDKIEKHFQNNNKGLIKICQ